MSGALVIDHVEIVDLERRHLRALMRLDAVAYPEPWSRALWLRELQRSDRIYLAAELDGHLVGFAGALLALDDAHVTTIVAEPGHQRRGIASRLLLSLIERAIAAGATALTLEVRVSNTAAQALYRKFGLAPAGVRRDYYEPEGEDALVMWAHDIDGDDYRHRLDGIERHLYDAPTEVRT